MKRLVLVLSLFLVVFGCMSIKETKLPKPFPIEPVNGKVVPYSDEGVHFKWGIRSPYEGWTYRLNISPMNSALTYISTTTSLEGTVTGLVPGGYVWWVEVVSPSGSLSRGDTAEFYLGGPGRLRLSSPDDGSAVPSGEVELTWVTEFPSGVYYHEIEICSDSCEKFSTLSTSLRLFLDEGNYTWKVKVIMMNGGSDESPSWSFSVFRYIVPLNPPNGAVDVDPDSVVLEWKGCNESCEVVITSEDSEILREMVNSTSLMVSSLKHLEYSKYYTWYVSKGDTRSVEYTFRTHDPNAPMILSPSNGAVGVDPSEFLNWTYSDDIFSVDHYLVYLSETPNPTRSILVYGETIAISDLAEELTVVLEAGNTYYWCIQAVDGEERKSPKGCGAFRLK